MRKVLFLIAALLASPALANEDDPYEIGRNFLHSHSKIVALSGKPIASGEDFARHFPINEYGCEPKLDEQPGKDTIFVMAGPAYWGSGQRTKFGFAKVQDTLVLIDVRINGTPLEGCALETFLRNPFRTVPTFQAFLLFPGVKIIGTDGKTVGMLAPSIQRLWKEAYNCELIGLDPKDSSVHLLCPYNGDTSNPRTFDYDFKLTKSGNLVITSAHGRGRDKPGVSILKANELLGTGLLTHAQTHFGIGTR